MFPQSVIIPLLIVLPSVATCLSDERRRHVHLATTHVMTMLQL